MRKLYRKQKHNKLGSERIPLLDPDLVWKIPQPLIPEPGWRDSQRLNQARPIVDLRRSAGKDDKLAFSES